MLCKLLTEGGDFRVMAKNPTQFKAIARMMQAAFPSVPMRGTFNLDKALSTVNLETEKGAFTLSVHGVFCIQ